MAKADVLNIKGEKVGEVELNDAVWGAMVKPYLIHDVVTMQLTNRRRGTASTKTRGRFPGAARNHGSRKAQAGPGPEVTRRPYGSAVARCSDRSPRNTT